MDNATDAPDEEITTRQALEILGYANPSTVTRWVAEHKLKPSRKLPGQSGAFLFWRSDIERIARERAADRAGAPA